MKTPHSKTFQRALEAYSQGRLADAGRLCRTILASNAGSFEALHLLADVQSQSGQLADAVATYDQALAIAPNHADVLIDRGSACLDLKRYEEALSDYNRSLRVRPGHPLALFNCGVTLQALGRPLAALSSYDQALAAAPQFHEALNNSGLVLKSLRRTEEALARFDRALAIRPDHAKAHNNRGNALAELGRPEEALASYDRSIAIRADDPEAHYNRGSTLVDLKRYGEARVAFERALKLSPDHQHAFNALAESVVKSCDWSSLERLLPDLCGHVQSRKSAISPFLLIGVVDDPSLHLQCARNFVDWEIPNGAVPSVAVPRRSVSSREGQRIKIAYLSTDYCRHTMASLVAGLLERHDHSRFEIIGISYGPDDRSDIRAQIISGCDQFHDVRNQDDRQVAALIRDLDVDIAVDLNGHTRGARPGVLALRPAPIQVNYLGYPGTLGGSFVDYIICDPEIAPFDQQTFYTEQIVHLPECYQVNDNRRVQPRLSVTRSEAGLPAQGFVFCCFNQSYKITPRMFDVWMRLLSAVDGSVLWLLQDSPEVDDRLRKEAMLRGVDQSRLIFAARAPLEEHLGRHALADLFLDTLPYNAHTTANDALWMGLPIVTCEGKAFAGRVAASILKTAGLPELITHSLVEYESLALRLARHPELLADMKARLLSHRESSVLFDTARTVRHIEQAYVTMFEAAARGEAPRSFQVPVIS